MGKLEDIYHDAQDKKTLGAIESERLREKYAQDLMSKKRELYSILIKEKDFFASKGISILMKWKAEGDDKEGNYLVYLKRKRSIFDKPHYLWVEWLNGEFVAYKYRPKSYGYISISKEPRIAAEKLVSLIATDEVSWFPV